jgi:hypothetical protein
MEISGAMGDLGTYIPIVVALSIQCAPPIPLLCHGTRARWACALAKRVLLRAAG